MKVKRFESMRRNGRHETMRTVILLAVLCLFSFFWSEGESYATQLQIGIIPEKNVFEQVERYRSLGRYIENETGIKINFTILSKYGNTNENYIRKNLDGAFWGSMTGAHALKLLGMKPVASIVDRDHASHHGYIFVHKYSVIDSVERMRDVEVVFVDKATTAGYVFPLAFFREGGVSDLDAYFKRYYFSGSHKDAITAVLERKVDIGCADNTVFEMMARENPKIKDELVIIAKSPELPSITLGVNSDIPLALREDLKKVLVGMSDKPEGRKVLGQFGAQRFIEASVEDYAVVFDLAGKAGLELERYVYNNN